MNEPLHSSPRIAAILSCTGAELRGLCNFTNSRWRIQPKHGAGTRSALWTDLEALRLFALWELKSFLGPEQRRRLFDTITDEQLVAAKDDRGRFIRLLDAGDDDEWSADVHTSFGKWRLLIDGTAELDLNDVLSFHALNLTRLVKNRLRELRRAEYDDAPEGDE